MRFQLLVVFLFLPQIYQALSEYWTSFRHIGGKFIFPERKCVLGILTLPICGFVSLCVFISFQDDLQGKKCMNQWAIDGELKEQLSFPLVHRPVAGQGTMVSPSHVPTLKKPNQ